MLTCIITNCGKRHCVFLSNIGYIFSSVSSVDIENLILEFFEIDETQYSYVTSLRSNHVLVINLDTRMHKQDFILVMGISQSSFHLFTECIFSLEVHKNNAYLQDGRRVAYYVIYTAVEPALDLHFSYVNLFLSWLIFKIVQEEKMKIQNEILVPNKNVHKAKQFVCIRVLYYKLINTIIIHYFPQSIYRYCILYWRCKWLASKINN